MTGTAPEGSVVNPTRNVVHGRSTRSAHQVVPRPAPADCRTSAPTARRCHGPHGRGRDGVQAGSAPDAADSTPTDEPAPRGTRDRPGGQRPPPFSGPCTTGRLRAPFKSTQRRCSACRCRTQPSRSPVTRFRSPGNQPAPGAHAAANPSVPNPRLLDPRPWRRRSRDARASRDAGRCSQARAYDRRSAEPESRSRSQRG